MKKLSRNLVKTLLSLLSAILLTALLMSSVYTKYTNSGSKSKTR